ncbi:MAG: glycosyltransferase family 2 protein [Gemmatimonadales bacterium]
MTSDLRISVVVPVFNEEANILPLADAVRAALGPGPDWELLLVDDGSTDGSRARVLELRQTDPRIRLVPLARNFGQTAAMQAGFDHASGRVVVSMDGDLQNDPLDISRVAAMLEQGYDLVVGYRERRQDKLLTRKLPSWVANRIIRALTGVPIRDNGCSLKGYRRELLDRLHLYSDMHRFIPAVAAATAGARIAEIPVRHHPRRFGRSKYGLSRVVKVLMDLLTITMIRSFRERPLALFATGAVASLLIAAAFGVASVVSLTSFQPSKAAAVVLPGAALVWVALAAFLLMLGLLGEMALRESREGESDLPLLTGERRG